MLSFPILGCGRVQRLERAWGVGFRNRVSGWTGGLEMSGGGGSGASSAAAHIERVGHVAYLLW